jgi:ATP-dependent Lon protease
MSEKKLKVLTSNSLQVAKSKINDDAEFKVGIYSNLQGLLPLIYLENVDQLKAILDTEFPWFANVTDVIHRQLIVQQHSATPAFKLRPILLAGGPGVGKTSYVKRLAELAELPFRSLMAAGANDSMFLRGTPRGWSSARPSAIANLIASNFVANPMILVDELDKASSDIKNGRVWDVLLQLLEPSSASVYLDECLQVPCDFSFVSWIATANEIGMLPKPLLERFTVILVQSPGPEHFETLLNGVISQFAHELGIDYRMLPTLDHEDVNVLRNCRSPREINKIARMMIEDKMVSDRKKMRWS